jgi:hypothetical protein
MSIFTVYTNETYWYDWIIAFTEDYEIFFYNGPYNEPIVGWSVYTEDLDINVCRELEKLLTQKMPVSQFKNNITTRNGSPDRSMG